MLCEFRLNEKLKYLKNSKYLLAIKYMIVQTKHLVHSVPIICCLLSDPTLLPALLISVIENTSRGPVVTLELINIRWWEFGPKSVSVGPGVMNQSCGYFSGSRMQSWNGHIWHCQKSHISSWTHGVGAIIVGKYQIQVVRIAPLEQQRQQLAAAIPSFLKEQQKNDTTIPSQCKVPHLEKRWMGLGELF